MGVKSYYDCAEDDYLYLRDAFSHGFYTNSNGATAQSICERYMKHIISEYYKPEDKLEIAETTSVMKTHNLNSLIRFLDSKMGIRFSDECRRGMSEINGYYFTTRYPGEDSEELTEDDIRQCIEISGKCREDIKKIIGVLEQQIKEEQEEGEWE